MNRFVRSLFPHFSLSPSFSSLTVSVFLYICLFFPFGHVKIVIVIVVVVAAVNVVVVVVVSCLVFCRKGAFKKTAVLMCSFVFFIALKKLKNCYLQKVSYRNGGGCNDSVRKPYVIFRIGF